MKCAVYQDYVSNNGILSRSLSRIYGANNVLWIDAIDVIQGRLDHSDIYIFIMPGGASRYKEEKLRGAGFDRIRKFVERGGRYVGICAGAYTACALTEWDVGGQYEIIRKNELAFFPGAGRGPLKAFSTAESYNGSDARIVCIRYDGRVIPSLYWGGPEFHPFPDATVEVCAQFEEPPNKPAAIVRGTFGKGHWLLSSTHIEFDDESLELIRFNAIGNNYADIAALPAKSELTLDLMRELISTIAKLPSS